MDFRKPAALTFVDASCILQSSLIFKFRLVGFLFSKQGLQNVIDLIYSQCQNINFETTSGQYIKPDRFFVFNSKKVPTVYTACIQGKVYSHWFTSAIILTSFSLCSKSYFIEFKMFFSSANCVNLLFNSSC